MTRIKAVFHAHSTWSYDGSWTLTEIARFFGRLGADAVFMTEHDTGFDPERFPEFIAECAEASKAGAVLVPGIEYSSPDNDIHILTWGLSRFLAEHRPVPETLEQVRAAGGVAVFAHPVRRDAWAQFDDDWVPYLAGIELWNRKSDGILYGQEALDLIKRTGLPATTGCDFHRLLNYYPLSNSFTKAPEQSIEEAGMVALKAQSVTPQLFGRAFVTGAEVKAPLHAWLEPKRRALMRKLKAQKSGNA